MNGDFLYTNVWHLSLFGFAINWFSKKCQKNSENPCYNFPKIPCFTQKICPKSKYVQFTTIYDKEKQQILTYEKPEAMNVLFGIFHSFPVDWPIKIISRGALAPFCLCGGEDKNIWICVSSSCFAVNWVITALYFVSFRLLLLAVEFKPGQQEEKTARVYMVTGHNREKKNV